MINIAIDGPVGSGKSELAKLLSKRLGFYMLDTGALYRGIACYYRYKFNKPINKDTVDKLVKEIDVDIKFIDSVQHVFVCGIDFTPNLREEEISMLSSEISSFPEVRAKILNLQQNFAKEHNCILEGRDIGTVVLPNAEYKFYLTADEEIRAKRRYEQIKDKPNAPTYEKVLDDLRKRDFDNRHRKVAPLKPANDSIIIDNSNINLEQTLEKILTYIKL